MGGQVAFAMEVPWHACLPRLETRLYIEQYGGEDDVWIGKTLYRYIYISTSSSLILIIGEKKSTNYLISS